MKYIVPTVMAFVLLASCAKEVDFDQVDDIRFSPGATVPLINAKLTLEDLVQDSTALRVDPDDALRVYFRQDSVFTYSNTDLLKVPNQDPLEMVLNESLSFLRVGLGLGTIAGAELFQGTFLTGRLVLEVEASDPAATPLDFRLTWHNALQNGQTVDTVFRLAPGQTSLLDSSFLRNALVDFTNNGNDVNFLDFELSIVNPGDIPAGADYNCKIYLRNLEIDAANGYFGSRIVNAPNGEFNFQIPGIERFSGGFFLTNPTLSLIVTSTTGIPIDIHVNFTGENRDMERLRLQAPAFNLLSAPGPGQPIVNNYTLDANNANVTEFLALIPQKILYSGYAEVNPQGKTGTPNFIATDSRVRVDFEADVPLELRLENMRFRQTIENVNLSFDQSQLFESLTLFFKSRNEIPFDLNVSVAFIDSVTGDSANGVNLQILSPASVDASGRVQDPYRGNEAVELNQDQIAALMRSNALRFEARVSTANNGLREVKIYADYSLDLQIAIESKLNIGINEL